MLRGKRGFTLIHFLWAAWAVIAIIVAVVLFGYINGVADDTLFEQNFMARDIALLLDSAYAAPGDVQLIYEINTSVETEFGFAFDRSKVLIFDYAESTAGITRSREASFPFAEDKAIEFLPSGILVIQNIPRISGQISHTKTKENILFKKLANEVTASIVSEKNE